MDRRDFLKKAGLGSIAIASIPALPALANQFAGTASAHGRDTNWHVLSVSAAGADVIVLVGHGEVDNDDADGGGAFTHFDASTPEPHRIVGAGVWRARRLRSFDLIGTFGVLGAGIVEMTVDLRPQGGPPVRGAILRIACNLEPAGLLTGEPEGFRLSIPGALTFEQIDPPIGASLFTTVREPN